MLSSSIRQKSKDSLYKLLCMLRVGEVVVGTLDQVQLVVLDILVKLFSICVGDCCVTNSMNGQHLTVVNGLSYLCHVYTEPFLHVLWAYTCALSRLHMGIFMFSTVKRLSLLPSTCV